MNRIFISVAALFVVAGLTACESEIDNQPAANVQEVPVTEKQAATEAKPAAAAYELDLASSTFVVVGAKLTADHSMDFERMTAEVQVLDGKVTSGTVNIEMASVKADVEKLTKHLKSPDFFDVENHPNATFVVNEIKEGTMAAGRQEVFGTLALRGKTKKISFPADLEVKGDVATVRAQFTINRKDFGIVYPGKPDDLIRDAVLVKMNLTLKKKG